MERRKGRWQKGKDKPKDVEVEQRPEVEWNKVITEEGSGMEQMEGSGMVVEWSCYNILEGSGEQIWGRYLGKVINSRSASQSIARMPTAAGKITSCEFRYPHYLLSFLYSPSSKFQAAKISTSVSLLIPYAKQCYFPHFLLLGFPHATKERGVGCLHSSLHIHTYVQKR